MNDAGVYKKFYPDSQDIQAASQIIIIPTTLCIAFPNAAVTILVILSPLLFHYSISSFNLLFLVLCFDGRGKLKRKWHLAKKKE